MINFTARIFVCPDRVACHCLCGDCHFQFVHTHTQTLWDVADVREALRSHIWKDHGPNPPKLRIDLRFENGGTIKNDARSDEAGPTLKATSNNRAV